MDESSHLGTTELKRRDKKEDKDKDSSLELPSIAMTSPTSAAGARAAGDTVPVHEVLAQKEDQFQMLITVVGFPLLVLAFVAIIVILSKGQPVLQPLFIAVFFWYLVRPLVSCLTLPFGECLRLACCVPVCRFFYRRCCQSAQPIPIKQKRGNIEDYDYDDEDMGLLSSKRAMPERIAGEEGCGRHRCPHSIAVTIAFAMVIGIIGGCVIIVINSVSQFEAESLDMYEKQADKMRAQFLEWLEINFKVDGKDVLTKLSNDIGISSMFSMAFSIVYNTFSGLFVVLLFILYLLFEKSSERYSKESLRGKIDQQIQRYILLKTLISSLVASVVYVILGPVLRTRLSSLWTMLTFILNFIPNVGPILATFLPLPVVLFDPELSSLQMLMAFLLPGAVHAVVGNLIEPKVFGNHLELHPIFLLLSLSFWFTIWGVSGAILCVPIMAVVKIVISHSQHPYATGMILLMEGNLYPLMAKPNPNEFVRRR